MFIQCLFKLSDTSPVEMAAVACKLPFVRIRSKPIHDKTSDKHNVNVLAQAGVRDEAVDLVNVRKYFQC